MTSNDKDLIISAVNTALSKDNSELIDESKIDKLIDWAALSPDVSAPLTEQEKDQIRRIIHETHSVRLGQGVAIVRKGHKKWFLQAKPSLDLRYWDRFKKYLVGIKHFPAKVADSMDADSDEIVDLLGDPTNTDIEEQRRGLIIGDVQSGKTANYSGVICKAVDAGYRVVILLTGTSNDLRRQTQIRLDEAFLGFDSAAFSKGQGMLPIGAGRYDDSLHPTAMTNVDCDFNKRLTQVSMSLPSITDNNPMLFVCKKNVSVLNSLYNWIASCNKYGEKKINNTILMIDDEADYASINTRDDEDPTATNKCIRKILNAFRFASYVGFTATPYANIFIEPQTDEDMQNDDLFPADYIYTLESPTNYIGARNIFGPYAKHDYMLREIDDAEDYYSYKHKKDSDFRHISPSLKRAINTFLVANVIRDLDQDEDSYRSMMVNVSRYVNTQNQLHETIKKYIEHCQSAIKAYSHFDVKDALDNEYIHGLFEAFESEYSNTDYSWEDIQASLERSIVQDPILVLCANQGNADLNYENYSGKIRAIVIGGQALSRGLTLEGLMVSYIYRRSMAYDTLMQMGRWFGYRDRYSRYCRIYMDPECVSWYAAISDATDELREEIKRMRERNATPRDFGLKVRQDPEVPLLVTSRNKMRGAQTRTFTTSLSAKMVETQSLCNDDSANALNIDIVKKLFCDGSLKRGGDKKKVALLDVPKERIVDMLGKIKVSELNMYFDPEAIASYVDRYDGEELDKWDVVIASGTGDSVKLLGDLPVKLIRRKSSLIRDGKYILLNKNRLGSPSDMSFGLTDSQKEAARGNKEKSPSANDYLQKNVGKRNALLVIYFVEATNEHDEKLVDSQIPCVGFSVGIPYLKDQTTTFINYQVNKIYQLFGDASDDVDDASYEKIEGAY